MDISIMPTKVAKRVKAVHIEDVYLGLHTGHYRYCQLNLHFPDINSVPYGRYRYVNQSTTTKFWCRCAAGRN